MSGKVLPPKVYVPGAVFVHFGAIQTVDVACTTGFGFGALVVFVFAF
jgi:hypothetical protein